MLLRRILMAMYIGALAAYRGKVSYPYQVYTWKAVRDHDIVGWFGGIRRFLCHDGYVEDLSHIYCLNRIIDNIEVIPLRTVRKCESVLGEVVQEFRGGVSVGDPRRDYIRNVLLHMCAAVRVVFTDIP